ncbi:MAG TPA: DUF5665 domain-containing protein [Candidatus Saccharimonadales bacterium]|nr:DUF5665 domain-containing protein [Candidatus Saccharimonadales bacterium]
MGVTSAAKTIRDNEVKGAPRAMMEELFQDFYKHRNQIYVMNFVRGVFFGFGSVVGGTLVVALLLWILSMLHYVPFVDTYVDATQRALEKSQEK